MPWELATYRAVETFGVKAVTGKDVLTAREITGMRTANLIVTLYQQREASGEWAKWEKEHPKQAAALEAAHRVWQSK